MAVHNVLYIFKPFIAFVVLLLSVTLHFVQPMALQLGVVVLLQVMSHELENTTQIAFHWFYYLNAMYTLAQIFFYGTFTPFVQN